MKAIVIHKYGGPEELRFEDYADPVPEPGEIRVRMAATSFNPFDIMRRSGAAREFAPIKFPGIVFAMSDQTYAELGVVKAGSLASPAGLDLIEAAALPLATTTGNQLISLGTAIRPGQTVLVTGAVGKLQIPIGRKLPLRDAEQGHAALAKGSPGKSLLVVSES